jgi:hypothetical protein
MKSIISSFMKESKSQGHFGKAASIDYSRAQLILMEVAIGYISAILLTWTCSIIEPTV